jgi:hypothetical protein
MSKGTLNCYFLKLLVFVFLLFILDNLAYPQSLINLSLDFTRLLYKDKKTEKISGQIFYSDSVTFIKISYPLNQWVLYRKDGIIIFYPDEKNAIKINSNSPAFLPFFHSILGLVDENINLDKLHYTIVKRIKSRDTLKIFWKPPKELKGNLGEYHVSLLNDNITAIENFDNKGKLVLTTHYEVYKKFDGRNFPTKTITLIYTEKAVNKEEAYFSNIHISKKISDEMRNFKIPKDVKIKNIDW